MAAGCTTSVLVGGSARRSYDSGSDSIRRIGGGDGVHVLVLLPGREERIDMWPWSRIAELEHKVKEFEWQNKLWRERYEVTQKELDELEASVEEPEPLRVGDRVRMLNQLTLELADLIGKLRSDVAMQEIRIADLERAMMYYHKQQECRDHEERRRHHEKLKQAAMDVRERVERGQEDRGGEKEKTLSNSDVNGAIKNVPDLQVFGNGDAFQLLCKASSQSEGWMKSTKAMEIPGLGCLVQVTTQQRNPDGSYAVAEALTYVYGVTIEAVAQIIDGEEVVMARRLVPVQYEAAGS